MGAALREQNATLKAKLEKLQKYAQSMPLGAMCNIQVPDGADEDRLNSDIPVDRGLDEPRDKGVFVRSQWAMDPGSQWWNGMVHAGSFFQSHQSGAGTGTFQQVIGASPSEGNGSSTV